MADFLKSAFGMLGGPQLRCRNDFVGQVIELGNQKLRVKRLIAEGGFAFVFEAQDITHGKNYALKRLMVNDEEKNLAVMEEIKCVRKLSGHPNIVDFITAAFINHDRVPQLRDIHPTDRQLDSYWGNQRSGGQLVDKLNVIKPPLPADLVLRIFYQVCRAVQHMHSQKVPIIHRDLKVENILLGDHGTIKLCDFGSATTKTHLPDPSWSAIQRSLVEDELSKNTTPMYRAPEMLDLYQNFPINEALDMWALGCILYLLCYKQHPFEDSAKLRILNGKYIIPESVVDYSIFHDMLMGMLRVNPVDRPTITDIVNRIHEIASAQGINLSEPLGLTSGTSRVTGSPDHPPHVKNLVQSHSSPSKNNHSYAEAGSPASALFSSIKGGAGSLVKNIRDASTKVMDTVSASMNRAELDISYITSRLAVMSYPAEGMESVIKNHIDDVRAFLESHHHDCYAVYNLTKRSYRVTKFENRVSECGWSQQRAPKLSNLFAICKNMHLWLSQNRHNVCIIHCLDGKANSATVVAAFLIFVKLVDSVASALHMFSTRRGFPCISPSQKRYVEYIWQMAADVPFIPHHQPVLISSITLSPVPLFNRMRNGCTPFVEVYMEEERIASTSLEYEKIKHFSVNDGCVDIPVDILATGDITIIVYHARSTFGGKIQGKITSMKMFQLQFYSGLVQEGCQCMSFTRCDLDLFDTAVKYPEPFSVVVELKVCPVTCKSTDRHYPWDNFSYEKLSSGILFSCHDEMKKITTEFGGISHSTKELPSSSDSVRTLSTQSTPTMPLSSLPSPPGPCSVLHEEQSKTDFFSTLHWSEGEVDGDVTLQAHQVQVGQRSNVCANMDDFTDFSGVLHNRSAIFEVNPTACPLAKPDLFNFQHVTNGISSTNTCSLSDSNVAFGDGLGSVSFHANQIYDGHHVGVDLLNICESKCSSIVQPDVVSSNLDQLIIGKECRGEEQGMSSASDVDLLGNGVMAPSQTSQSSCFIGNAGKEIFSSLPSHPAGSADVSISETLTNTFDPFKSAQPAVSRTVHMPMTPLDESHDDFIAFMERSCKKNEAELNLFGSWTTENIQDSHLAVSSHGLYQHREDSMPGLSVPMGMHKSASTGTGMNMSLNGGGGRGVSMSSSYSINSSLVDEIGPVPRAEIGPVPRADPFAEFGDLGKTSFRMSRPVRSAPHPSAKLTVHTDHAANQSANHPSSRQPNKTMPGSSAGSKSSHMTNKWNAVGETDERGNLRNLGTRPKVSDDDFMDLLGEHHFTPSQRKDDRKAMVDMRRKQLEDSTDPDVLQVMEWTKGKECNIRALLCSLHKVLWDGERRWKPCGMHDLITVDQVKKYFRKAVLSVHPDKLHDDPHEELATLIFMELSDSWAKFEEEGMKSLY